MELQNTATRDQKGASERKRIPMSTPVQKPGFHLHWFTSDPARIQRALEGGYEFVDEQEVRVNAVGLGGDSAQSGNTDLGSRVSVVAGGIGADSQPNRLILMKIKQEWYEEDQQVTEARSDKVAMALRGGAIGAEREKGTDGVHRYVDKARTVIPDLFTPKRGKSRV
jgi:hypothetical protein